MLTNKPGDMSRTILNGLGVGSRFARVWGADDVPARKPDPAGLRALLAELGAAAEEVGWSATRRSTSRPPAPPACAPRVSPRASTEAATGGRTGPLLDNPRELVLLA